MYYVSANRRCIFFIIIFFNKLLLDHSYFLCPEIFNITYKKKKKNRQEVCELFLFILMYFQHMNYLLIINHKNHSSKNS